VGMMGMFNGSDDFNADKLISDFKSMNKIEEQLKFVLLHLYSLDRDTQEKFRPQIVEYEKIMANNVFMRQVKYRDSLAEDYPSEYFGTDFGDDDPFIYDEKLELQISKISMRLLATVGLIAKAMKEKNIVIGEDT
jgi:hypothetical protein